MDRRTFVLGFLGATGAAAAVALAPREAQAAALQDLAAMPAPEGTPERPAPGEKWSIEKVRWHGHRRRHWRRRRRVCTVHRNRWGRLVRRCWWR